MDDQQPPPPSAASDGDEPPSGGATTPDGPGAPASPSNPQNTGEGRAFAFPGSLTVLALVTVAVWALAFLIPPGRYRRDADGAPVQGSYRREPDGAGFLERLGDLFLAPVNGLYGIEDAETGRVGPEMAGELYGSAGVFLFVLAIGTFITVVFATGAMDRGIGRLAHRLRRRGTLLIAGMMVVFALLGTVEGFAEETLGFYGLVIPLALALGYDRMVATGTIILGAGVGVLCSTVNPFATGVASAAAEISLGDGIALRAAMWLVLTSVTVAYVVRYARRVKAEPGRSLVGYLPGDRERASAGTVEQPPLSGRHQAVLVAVVLAFGCMVFSVIPWSGVVSGDTEAAPYAFELGWSFPQLAAFFIAAAVLVGLVGGLGGQLSATVSRGAADFITPALVIVLARGVTVIMNNARVTDTVLHSMEEVVSSTPAALFGVMVYLVNLPLAFLIPSTSGHATLAMPILAPLADFAGVPRALTVTAWNAASGWMNLWVPTTAVVMGGLSLARVGYHRYLRFVWPLLAILAALVCGFVALGAALG